jgi:hypothetical protein
MLPDQSPARLLHEVAATSPDAGAGSIQIDSLGLCFFSIRMIYFGEAAPASPIRLG